MHAQAVRSCWLLSNVDHNECTCTIYSWQPIKHTAAAHTPKFSHSIDIYIVLHERHTHTQHTPRSMKKEAEEKKLPPIYRGKWALASKEEVEAMKATGAPYCYRFRVPKVCVCLPSSYTYKCTAQTNAHILTHTRKHSYHTRAHTHIHTRTHPHTHIHTYTHMHNRAKKSP